MIEQKYDLTTTKPDQFGNDWSGFAEFFSQLLTKMLDSHSELIYNYFIAEKFMCKIPQKYNYRVFCFTL